MTDTPRETIPADIRERLAKAGGPWRLTRRYPMMIGHGIALQRAREIQHEAETGQVFGLYIGRAHDLPLDAFEFIAHAPDDIRTLLAECDTLRAQLAKLTRELEIVRAAQQRMLPCPDCRDKVQEGQCERCARQRAEAQLAAREGEIATLTEGWAIEREDATQWMNEEAKERKRAEAAEARADTAEAQLRAQADEITRLTVERNQQAAEADRYCSQYVDHAKAIIQLRAGLERATAMCRAATTWNADDLQGLRFHAQEAAREGMAALAAPPITKESQP